MLSVVKTFHGFNFGSVKEWKLKVARIGEGVACLPPARLRSDVLHVPMGFTEALGLWNGSEFDGHPLIRVDRELYTLLKSVRSILLDRFWEGVSTWLPSQARDVQRVVAQDIALGAFGSSVQVILEESAPIGAAGTEGGRTGLGIGFSRCSNQGQGNQIPCRPLRSICIRGWFARPRIRGLRAK